MAGLLIKNGRVIDPASGVDEVTDVLIEKGVISKMARNLKAPSGAKVIDATGKWVTPGLIDMHTHLREPGYEYKETIETGALSAAVGGFTSIACMANTNPVNDSASVTDMITEKAKKAVVNVFPIGAVTQGLKGEKLAEIGEMAECGVVALSDDGKCVMDARLMRLAMEYGSMFGLTLIEHAEDHSLSGGGVMNEGAQAVRMGLVGQPKAAEDSIVARDITLAEYLDLPVHIAHLSSAYSIELIREAKRRGVKVTGEAAPHHFTLTDVCCDGYDTNAKMAPPLREDKDVEAIKKGLKDGTIDCIATDHAPHSADEKETEFDQAAFGIVGLETALPLSLALVDKKVLTPSRLIETLTSAPAKILGIERGSLSQGAVADVTIIDPEAEWVIDPSKFRSKGKNTPFGGWKVKGRADVTIVKGRVVHEWQ